jgi:hypothetical protein
MVQYLSSYLSFIRMVPSRISAKVTTILPKKNWYSGGWSPIGSTRHCGHQWPIVPATGDYDDGEIGGMIGRGNRSPPRRNPSPVPLCPPQTPHAARTRTRAAAVGSQHPTAWATARPTLLPKVFRGFTHLSINFKNSNVKEGKAILVAGRRGSHIF